LGRNIEISDFPKTPSFLENPSSAISSSAGRSGCRWPASRRGESFGRSRSISERPPQNEIPSRELTYPTWGKGKSSSKAP